MLPSRWNAFMKNVHFLRCSWRKKMKGLKRSKIYAADTLVIYPVIYR